MIVYRRSLSSGISFLFTSEISWDFAPFRCLPLDDGIAEVVSGQPVFSSFDNLIQRLCFGRTLQFCLAFALVNPENGIVGITIDGLIEKTLIPSWDQSETRVHQSEDQCTGIPWVPDYHYSQHPPPMHLPSPQVAGEARCRGGNLEDSVNWYP